MENKTDYTPIEDYGIIGNLQTVALVSKQGSIDFMCYPQFDAPSIFASLLDKVKGGSFSVTPRMTHATYKQLYLPDTAILITRFFSDEGIAEITDFMPVDLSNESCTIYRRVSCVRGKLSFDMSCSPRFDYATKTPEIIIDGNCGNFLAGEQVLQLYSTTALRKGDESNITAEFTLKESEKVWFILEPCDKDIQSGRDLETIAHEAYENTIKYWHKWIEQSTYIGRWRELVHRSVITLKLLTSSKYGSVVAAPTFSLPEVLGGHRNWDYRFTWIRDGAFTMYAFLRMGFKNEAAAFLEWIRTQCVSGPLQLMYALDGSTELPEKILPQLEGYKQSIPVRIGNGASGQFQLDIYGELLDTIYLFNKEGGSVTFEFWKEIEKQVNFVAQNWRRPDHGIWEIRNEMKEFLHSRLMCWVAMDRAIKIAEDRSFPYPKDYWRNTRDSIYNDIYNGFWDEEVEAFVQYKGSKAVDASALLMPLMRFFSSKEPRWQKTLKTIDDKLRLDVLIYRYNNQLEKLDGLEGDEGTFTMCSFWYVECLCKNGQIARARENFEKMIGYANHVGLFAEEIGPKGEHLGNFPQAFTHLALISAALELNKSLVPI